MRGAEMNGKPVRVVGLALLAVALVTGAAVIEGGHGEPTHEQNPQVAERVVDVVPLAP